MENEGFKLNKGQKCYYLTDSNQIAKVTVVSTSEPYDRVVRIKMPNHGRARARGQIFLVNTNMVFPIDCDIEMLKAIYCR